MNWYLEVLRKYVVFTGRARRMEYWMFVLVSFLIVCGLSAIDWTLGLHGAYGTGLLTSLYALFIILPSLGVAVRRLHDIGRSGLWILIACIPVLGAIVLLIFHVMDSEPGENRYGPNPKTSDMSTAYA